jgi:hypothetical protein
LQHDENLQTSPPLPHSYLLVVGPVKARTHAKVGSMGHRADRARGPDGPKHKSLSDRIGGTLELGLTLLGEGHSKIKPRVDDTLEGVVKASHIRE